MSKKVIKKKKDNMSKDLLPIDLGEWLNQARQNIFMSVKDEVGVLKGLAKDEKDPAVYAELLRQIAAIKTTVAAAMECTTTTIVQQAGVEFVQAQAQPAAAAAPPPPPKKLTAEEQEIEDKAAASLAKQREDMRHN